MVIFFNNLTKATAIILCSFQKNLKLTIKQYVPVKLEVGCKRFRKGLSLYFLLTYGP